jgi:DNA-binding beta-propeller fold protein YncE
MKGDFTRFSFDPKKGYAQVLKQQGRVDLDADWNEASAIQAYLDRTRARDLIGLCGVPKKNAGFLVDVLIAGTTLGGHDLTLSAGRLYANGLLCETEGTTYLHQPYLPHPPALTPEPDTTDLVYLDVWQRHITAVEEPKLLEVALGGADTTTRLQTVWQVKVRPGVEETECDGGFAPWPPIPPLDQRGRLSTKAVVAPDEAEPCLIAPGGGYRGLENRLYRVEIHDGGQPYAWPRPASAQATAVSSIADGTKLTVADWSVDGRAWQVGQMVELYSDQTDSGGQAGKLVRIQAANQGASELRLDTDVSGMAGHTNLRLRRIATFKWSRDNGSVLFGIQEFVAGQPTKVRVKGLGRDQVLTLHAGDWVEVLGDETELKGLPGTLAPITPNGIDAADLKLTLGRDVSSHSGEGYPKVRRWDQKSGAIAVTGEWLELEDGVQIQFGGQDMQTGDYWSFAARTATGKVEELADAPPLGIEHAYCRLALVTWKQETSLPRRLIRQSIANKPEPDLAISWEVSEDAKTTIFKLVQDAQMPNGRPLTAAIVAEILAETGIKSKPVDDLTIQVAGSGKKLFDALAKIIILPGSERQAAEVTDCRPDFPTLTEICAEDVCYDDSNCDAIQAETVQEALDQLCAMRDLRFHNKHLHGWGIVCGLQVHCGADDPQRPGDRTTVTVLPGYAIDCEGNDIVLDDDLTVPILEMIAEWEERHGGKSLLKDGEGKVCLVIERDEHGQPRVVVRPYDPADDSLRAMLDGTLLMDFVQDCILEPWKEIRDLLLPTADDGGAIVRPGQRQLITLWNLVVQIWNPTYGAHVYLSPKEHEILRNLYLALRLVLQSKTFCAMFDDAHPFPDYPFDKARMSTIFDRNTRSRLRIHPKGQFAYGLGLNNQIHLYDLDQEELVAVLDVPGGAGLVVQDVAFSADGKQLYAIATLNDEDSIFAVAEIKGLDHKWRPVSILCDVQLRTLATVSGFEEMVFAAGQGDGLFVIKLSDVQPNIEPSVAFNAVGHLVVDEQAGRAYASAADVGASATAYDRVVEIDLQSNAITNVYPLQLGDNKVTGQDDIAIVPAGAANDLGKLYAVADGSKEGAKLLYIWQVGNPEQPATLSVPDTAIRLGYVPGSDYLMGTLEDWYLVGLVDVRSDEAVGGFEMPVQIAPLAIAVDPRGKWVYVVNALSPTITKIAAQHMVPIKEGEGEPPPGSAQFIEALVTYRQEIFAAFLDLVGGLLQYLKDCFCHHLLVNCPECDPEDEVYLASVTISEGEVYKVCNFSRRRYVKSFPTVGYWLSLIPITPFIHKAVELACCAVLPEFFGRLKVPQREAYQPPMKSQKMRAGVAAYQQGEVQKRFREVQGKVDLGRQTIGDWVNNVLVKAEAPSEKQKGIYKNDIVGQPSDQVIKQAEESGIITTVEAYDPSQGAKNLVRITQAPSRVAAGSQITLYEQDGVVRYYALTEKAPESVAAVRAELETQKAALAEMETLKTSLSQMQQALEHKDQELVAMRGQMQALEAKQARLEAAPELAKVTEMEAELKELRTFRTEVKKFMEGPQG